MKARVAYAKSPTALSDEMAAVLRVIMLTPLLDSASIFRETGSAAMVLNQLVSRGFVNTQASRKINGKATTLYVVTLKGMDALGAHIPAPRGAAAVSTVAPTLTGYTCPELSRTCPRPGAYDAFSLPSLIGKERRVPRSAT